MERNVEMNEVIKEIFKSRIKESKIFTKQEISVILSNVNLFSKCYTLGIIDTKK